MKRSICHLCHSSNNSKWAAAIDTEYLTTQDSFDFYHCYECQTLFIHPMPVDKLNIIYPNNYYSFSESPQSVVTKIKTWLDKKLFKKILHQLVDNHLYILDVGGGSGAQLNLIRSIEKRKMNTYIVDLDAKAEQLAIKNGHTYFCARIEDFQTAIQFDLVILLNLIEHVANPDEVLAKIRSMLKPTGMILVKTPNFDSLDARIFRHKNWGGYHCPRHWTLFTKSSFEKLVNNTNLRIHYFSYTQGAPFWAQSILALLAKKGLVEVSKEKPMTYHPLFKCLSAFFALVDFIRRPFAKTSQMFFILKPK